MTQVSTGTCLIPRRFYEKQGQYQVVRGWDNIQVGMGIMISLDPVPNLIEQLISTSCDHCAQDGRLLRIGEIYPILSIDTADPTEWGFQQGRGITIRRDCLRAQALSSAYFDYDQRSGETIEPTAFYLPGITPQYHDHPAAAGIMQNGTNHTLDMTYRKKTDAAYYAILAQTQTLVSRLGQCALIYSAMPGHVTQHEVYDLR